MTAVAWSDVEVGDVLDLKGKRWAVTSRIGGKTPKVTVERVEDGKAHTGPIPAGTVERVERAAPAIPQVDPSELASAVVQSRLGGEVLAERVEGAAFQRCPKAYQHPGTLLAHLYVFHGVRDWKDGDAEALHAEAHANAGGAGYVDHTHDL